LEIGLLSTSFDVVSDWRKATRYGFLSDFYKEEAGVTADVEYLRKLHVNLVQYYDWMYRHDDLVPPQAEFRDLMGRELSLSVVEEKIALCRRYGMKSIAYGAVYATSREFYEAHRDWALYDSCGNVLDLIGLFFIMNIAAESPWHNHILKQYERTIELVGFDGIHMDTYGFPKTAISRLHGEEKVEFLKEQFPVLINHARERLERLQEDIGLIFNNVGNWPVDTSAPAKQDAVYIEVWHPYERYHHIQQIILRAKLYGAGKPVILAAYLKPFRDLPRSEWDKANVAALLLTAVISANGAYHLLNGEHQGVLTQAYYVDYSRLEDGGFIRQLRNYYDFIVRYANVLFDESLEDVTMTHAGGDNLEYVVSGIPWSTYGEAGKAWTIIRENKRFKTISLINLTNNSDDLWNEGKQLPLELDGAKISILLDGEVRSVFAASPDREMGRPREVPYTVSDGTRGRTLNVELTQVRIWELLVVELEG
jgi:dextranase